MTCSAVLANGDLVLGSEGTTYGGVVGGNVVQRTVLGWRAVGTELNHRPRAMATAANGDLIVVGPFSTAGTDSSTVTLNCVGRWDGVAWRPLGTGLSRSGFSYSVAMRAVAIMPTGDVIVAGDFNTAGGVAAGGVARWDGTSWAALGTGATEFNYAVYPNRTRLLPRPDGELLAAGNFVRLAGSAVNGAARWTGTEWVRLGTGIPGAQVAVRDGVLMSNGDLIVTGVGFFGTWQSSQRFARWNGTEWQPLAGGAGGMTSPEQLFPLDGGGLLAVQPPVSGGSSLAFLNRWRDGAWTEIGRFSGQLRGGVTSVLTIQRLNSGELFIGGNFTQVNGMPARGMVLYDGMRFKPVEIGMSASCRSLLSLSNGEIIATGMFETVDGQWVGGAVRGDGVNWEPLHVPDSPSAITSRYITKLIELANGDLLGVGNFGSQSSTSYSLVARWTGDRWVPLPSPSPLHYGLSTAAELPNGDIVVGVSEQASPGWIARWNGVRWDDMNGGVRGAVYAMTVAPNGELIVGGSFLEAGGQPAWRVARWNGLSWTSMNAGVGNPSTPYEVNALKRLSTGEVLAGGYFYQIDMLPANGLARWSGQQWIPEPPQMAYYTGAWTKALLELPRGGLLTGGSYQGPAVVGGWHALQTVIAGQPARLATCLLSAGPRSMGVVDLALLTDGTVAVAGEFAANGANRPTNFARFDLGMSPTDMGMQPRLVKAWPGEQMKLVVPERKRGSMTFAWRRDGVGIDQSANPSAATSKLNLGSVTAATRGRYDCIMTDACGTSTSQAFDVVLRRGCSAADVAGRSTIGGDGTLDGSDVIAFINSFAIGSVEVDPIADIAGGGPDGLAPDGVIDGTDFVEFVRAFGMGC